MYHSLSFTTPFPSYSSNAIICIILNFPLRFSSSSLFFFVTPYTTTNNNISLHNALSNVLAIPISIIFTMLSWSLRTYSNKQCILQYINLIRSFYIYYSSTPNKPVLFSVSCLHAIWTFITSNPCNHEGPSWTMYSPV